ncbi:MAG TPA: beta-ketoacyl-ACP synthase II [Chloroflexia bacterium]|nr:beta-ketoacyl-ACP synthase II [Chloroflexia bacterium]
MPTTDRLPAAPPTGLAFETNPRYRVVVTGLGTISPHGHSVAEFWQGVSHGVSAVGPITHCDPSAYPTRIAAEVRDFDPAQWMNAREARRMSRASQFAVAAARQALDDSGVQVTDASSEEIGVLLGTGSSAFPEIEAGARTMISRGGMRMNPLFAPIILANMSASQVSIQHGLRGYNNTVITACAATTMAIGEAAEVIRRGAATVMVAGGTEAAISELGLAAFCLLRAMSHRNDDPQRASRPFEKNRDGMVPAEGAATLVLERLDHALARNARIYAELIGYGCSADAFHVVAPAPDARGAAKAMQRALAHAGIAGEDVDFINGHGTATDLNDPMETQAVKLVFGDYAYKLPMCSNKSMFGHLLGGCGSLEAIATIMSLRTGIMTPTINYETPDPACDLDYVPNVARQGDLRIIMKNNFGFGGQNASVIWRRWDEGDAAGLPERGH